MNNWDISRAKLLWSSSHWDITNINISKLSCSGALVLISLLQCSKFSLDFHAWWNSHYIGQSSVPGKLGEEQHALSGWVLREFGSRNSSPLRSGFLCMWSMLTKNHYILFYKEKLIGKMQIYSLLQVSLSIRF